MEFSFQIFRNCKTLFENCWLYNEKINGKGRISYKVFAETEDLQLFLKKNKDKVCENIAPIFFIEQYEEYSNTEVRKLTAEEIEKYMSER